MTNEEALEHLEEFRGCLHGALDATVWAQAFLTFGGEPTWDAVKDVSTAAQTVADLAPRIAALQGIYSEISP